MIINSRNLLATVVSLAAMPTYAYDNPHFYRATNLFPEPRLERNFLTSLDITIGGGATSKGRDFDHETVPLFDIFGVHNMQELSVGVPNKDLNNPLDLILNQLSLLPARENFATFSITGRFNIIETNVSLIQNFKRGFFIQFHIPIRRLQVKNITFNDLSPTDNINPNINTPEWQRFLQFFDDILERHNLSKNRIRRTGVGDLTSWIGWTHNYQETDVLDYIDIHIMIGILSSTGKQRDENNIFSIPQGYNGHWGVPINTALSFGAYEWLTLGGYLNAIFFANKTHAMRLKTGPQQSGLIKLAKGIVTTDKGSVWHAGLYVKADHVARGFSLTFAYSFGAKGRDALSPEKPDIFDPAIINSDEMLKGWKMHTIHLFAEYDFTQEDSKIGSRLGIFYNRQIGGKRIFKTNLAGGSFGLEIVWDV